jgi:hypothetical protein
VIAALPLDQNPKDPPPKLEVFPKAMLFPPEIPAPAKLTCRVLALVSSVHPKLIDIDADPGVEQVTVESA